MTHSSPKRIVALDSLQQINLNAAGLDIGDDEIWTAVPSDRDEQAVRCFGTFTQDLHALADWLERCGTETVAMEATGVYWIPIYEILEARGFVLCLVNGRTTKNVAGRKSDVLDCQWIQQLHTYGLLQASFRPPADICTLRTYVRQREMLLRYRSSHVQHMQKALQQMNLKLTNVITDITGQTGMQIIRAILSGEQDPRKLAQFRNPRCKSSAEEIARSLEGTYRPEHLFALQQAVALYDFYTQQLIACDAEIEQLYAVFEPKVDLLELPLPAKKKQKRSNDPAYDLRSYLYQRCGVDLTAVDGIDVVLAQDILAEIGTDMSKWPTAKHFTSWLGLAPKNDVSGGKVLRRGTQPVKTRANRAFRLAAQTVNRRESALGAFYRRIRTKHGAPVAITATARKLATIVYQMLKQHRPYEDPGAVQYEARYKQRLLRNLNRTAKRLGMQLVPADSTYVS
jgi:transposase